MSCGRPVNSPIVNGSDTLLLAVDIGNTQTVLGLFDGPDIREVWRIATSTQRTPDEVAVLVDDLFRMRGISGTSVDVVIVASVVPSLTAAFNPVAIKFTGSPALTVGPGLKTGLPIELDNPHEVGADRIANAVAAREYYGAPAIVVDFGTATNIDVVSPSGAYLGGVISPGLETSATALFSRAARLSAIDLEFPESPLGRSTRSAVQSGLMFGEAAKVDGLVRAIWADLGYETPVIATGGLAKTIAPRCATVTATDSDLTIRGLWLIAELHRTGKR